ncbi:MAG: hypothetical protein EHM61_00640 [Acidobacteria bacterium]|nr:MAG: hypothetical protein EHM61_00640 [Acidobacteriota bacterium]
MKRPWAILVILATWMVFAGPALWDGNWFYLDDATMLVNVKKVFDGFWWLQPHAKSGRFVPLSWFYRGLVWEIARENARLTFFFQFLLLLGTSFLTFGIVRRLGGGNTGAVLGASLFFLSSPFAENAYTLGKGEPLQLFTILLGTYLLIAWFQAKSRLSALCCLAGSVLALLGCVWAKETGIWMVGVFIVAFSLSLYLSAAQWRGAGFRNRPLLIVLIGTAATLLAQLPAWLFPLKAENLAYFSYQVTQDLIQANIWFYLYQVPDVFILGGLGILFAATAWWKVRSQEPGASLRLAVTTGLLAVGWGSAAGMMVWRMALGYYLYTAAAIFNVVVAIFLIPYLTRLRESRYRFAVVPVVAVVALLVSAKLYGAAYGYYVSTTQREAMTAYSGAVTEFVRRARPDGRIFIENWPATFEGTGQTGHLLRVVYRREDLKAAGIQGSFDAWSSKPGLQTPSLGNKNRTRPDFPIPGDCLLRLDIQKPAYWVIRGITPGFAPATSEIERVGMRFVPVWRTRASHRSVFFVSPFGFPQLGETSVQATLQEVRGYGGPEAGAALSPAPQFLSAGSTWWSDGWVPKDFSLRIFMDLQNPVLRISAEILPSDLPGEIRIVGPGDRPIGSMRPGQAARFASDFSLTPTLTRYANQYVTIRFLADSSFNPMTKGWGPDNRDLSWILRKVELRRAESQPGPRS